MKHYLTGSRNPSMVPRKKWQDYQTMANLAQTLTTKKDELVKAADERERIFKEKIAEAERTITERIDKELRDEHLKGWLEAQENLQTKVYAAVAITLKCQLGFGTTRIERFLKAMDERVWQYLDNDAAVEEAKKLTGIEVDFSEVFSDDRIKVVLDKFDKLAKEEAANADKG